MKYRDLLKKYLDLVRDEEGEDYLHSSNASTKFTQEELTALNKLVEELESNSRKWTGSQPIQLTPIKLFREE